MIELKVSIVVCLFSRQLPNVWFAVDETKAAQLKQEIVKEDSQDWILDGKDLEYLKRLGSGTSGDVFKGLYKGKHVAIKVLKEMTEDKERDEFKKEFVIMSSLGQTNVNIVYFYGASFKPKLCMVLFFTLYAVLPNN